jgi:dienelactone hydrolase
MNGIEVLCAVLAVGVGQAQEKKLTIAKIKLTHARASEVRRALDGGAWWERASGEGTAKPAVPEGVNSILAYDVDNTLIVRGTAEGIAAMRLLAEKLDVEPRRLRVWVRSVPVFRDLEGFLKAPEAWQGLKKSLMATVAKEFETTDNVPWWTEVGPNPFGKDDPDAPRNPSSGTIRPPWDSGVTIAAHAEKNGSVSLQCVLHYRDSAKASKEVIRTLLGMPQGEKAYCVLPIEDPRHPVEFYLLELKTEVSPIPEPREPALVTKDQLVTIGLTTPAGATFVNVRNLLANHNIIEYSPGATTIAGITVLRTDAERARRIILENDHKYRYTARVENDGMLSVWPMDRSTPPAKEPPRDRNLLAYTTPDGTQKRVTRPSEWPARREAILKAMQGVMGPLPKLDKPVPLDVKVESEERTEKYLRRKISYQSAAGERVPAYLLIPLNLKGKAPALLCLHQTTPITKDETVGLGGSPNLQTGKELAERGYVVLAPDYPTLGEHKIDLIARGWQSGSMKAIWDNMRGVDLLQSLPEVDGGRIGAIGHSLGGHNSLFTAAFEPRIKCVVTSCGFTAFARYYGGDLTGWSSFRYMPAIKARALTPATMPFDFHDVLAAIAPRPLFISAPVRDSNFEVQGVKEVTWSVEPVYRLLGGAGKLQAVYPDCGHDWPAESRMAAYAWLDRWLKK